MDERSAEDVVVPLPLSLLSLPPPVPPSSSSPLLLPLPSPLLSVVAFAVGSDRDEPSLSTTDEEGAETDEP